MRIDRTACPRHLLEGRPPVKRDHGDSPGNARSVLGTSGYESLAFQHLQRLPFGFHDKIHSGDLITRGMIDLEGTRMFIQNGMMMSLTLVLLLVVATGLMFAADPVLALLALTFVPISVYSLGRVGFYLRIAWMRVQTLMSILTLTMEENLQGIRVVRSFAARAFELAKFDRAASEALTEAYKRIVLKLSGEALQERGGRDNISPPVVR